MKKAIAQLRTPMIDRGDKGAVKVTYQGEKTVHKNLTKSERDALAATQDAFVNHVPDYRELRRAEYPEIGEQLDALWKLANSLRFAGQDLPQDADDMLGQVLAVKKKYPKPEAGE